MPPSRAWLGLFTAVVFGLGCPGSASASPGSFYVDQGSVGGPCSDSYTVTQASSPATPWCSMFAAAKKVPDGSTVMVRQGTYSAQIMHWPLGYNQPDGRSDYVTFEPYGYGTASVDSVTVDGIDLAGITHLRFQGMHLVGTDASDVPLTPAISIGASTQYIQLLDDEVTGQGIWLDHSTSHVLLQDNYVHDLTTNCAHTNPADGAGMRLGGTDIQVLNNRIERSPQDAMDMGASSNTLVADNLISTVPQSQATCGYHVDLIQAENQANGPVTIQSNTFDTGGQFILRNITGLTIQNNLILRVDGWMQLMADPGARIVNNTWWGGNTVCTGCGSLLLRDWAPGSNWTLPPYNYTNQMTGTVVENNVMRQFGVDSVPAAEYHEDYNLITNLAQIGAPSIQGLHTIFGSPSFVDAAGGDFHLAAGSLGIDAADSAIAPPADMSRGARWDDPQVPNTGAGPVDYVDIGASERQSPDGTPDPGPPAGGGTPPGGGGTPPGSGGGAPAPGGPLPDPELPAPPASPPPLTLPSSPPASAAALAFHVVSLRIDSRGRSLTVGVNCSEACRITATGTARVSRRSRRARNRVLRLPRVTRSIRGGTSARLGMRLPARLRQVLCRAGTVVLTVRASGRGQRASLTRTVHVRLRCSSRARRQVFSSS